MTSRTRDRALRAWVVAAALLPLPAAGDGDPLPDGAVVRLGSARLRHAAGVMDLEFTPDGSRLVSADIGGGVRVWSLEDGALLHAFDSGDGPLREISLDPGGRRLAVSREGRSAFLVDLPGGGARHDLALHGDRALHSPDGRRLAAWGPPSGRLRLLDATADGYVLRHELEEPVGEIAGAAFRPDGEWLALLGMEPGGGRPTSTRLALRETATGAVVHRLPLPGILLLDASFSPDGGRLAAGDAHGGVHVFDARSGERTAHWRGEDRPVRCVRWSPDGERLLVAGRATPPPAAGARDAFTVRDARSGEVLLEIGGHWADVAAVAASPDGRLIASACRDHVVRLFDARTGARRLPPAGHETGLAGLAVAAPGGGGSRGREVLLATAGADGAIGLWSAASGALLRTIPAHGPPVQALAISPDGALLASGAVDGSVRFWDAASGEGRGGWDAGPHGAARALAFSPEGDRLAVARQDGRLAVHAVAALPAGAAATMPEARLLESGGSIAFAVAWSPDGRRLAGASSRVLVHDTVSGEAVREIAGRSPIAALSFSPDGALLATACADRVVRLHDVASGETVAELGGHPGRVQHVAFSPDGRRLASAGDGETLVRLWDVERRVPAGTREGHAERVTGLAWLPDGRLVSSSADGTALVWAAAVGDASQAPLTQVPPTKDAAARVPEPAPAPAPAPVVPQVGTQSLDRELKPALDLANAGDFEGARAAVAAYRRLRGTTALEHQAEFLLGYAFQKQKAYAAAAMHLQRAAELAPDYRPPWHFLGFARYYLGDLEGARAAFLRHVELEPEEGENWFGLGLIAFDEDRLDEAEHAFRRAVDLHAAVLERDPEGRARAREAAKARARLADVLVRREQWTPAREQLEEAARLWPVQPEVWHKLHDVLLRLGEPAAAAEALLRRDEARARLGRDGAAVEDER